MKRLIASILMLVSLVAHAEIVTIPIPGAPGLSVTVGTGSNALPLQDIRSNPNAVNITTWDDAYVNVPLGFDFPFYGKKFNNSWAMTNGLVTFQDPAQSGLGGACCSGVDLSSTTDPRYNYTIFGVHSDLYSWNGQNQFYLREANAVTYGWYNLSQCCSSEGGNSFEIKITSSGGVDTRIAGALVRWNAVTSGMAGDLSKGEYYQYYHGSGINITPGVNSFSWNTLGTATQTDPCLLDPLSSPSCPGYAAAYLNQQCTISALYNPACPGYAKAYYDQQCSINPLYATDCPGYAEAYFSQQCSINGLYDTKCPNYAEAYAKAELLKKKEEPVVQEVTVVATPTAVAEKTVTPSTTTVTAAAPAAPVQLVQTPAATTTVSAPAVEKKVESTSTAAAEKPSTPRQQLAERRQAAARAEAIEKGNSLASEMGKASDMESQKQLQNAVIQVMGFTPGFDQYAKAMIPDTVGYAVKAIYDKQNNVDNRTVGLRLFGPSDRLHNDLVNSQFKR